MSTNAENKFSGRTFTDTVSVGGMAAKGLQESLMQKQKLLALFGKLAGDASNLMQDILTAVATASKVNVEQQATSFLDEQHAALLGAGVSFGSGALMEGVGLWKGGRTPENETLLENEAKNCDTFANALGKPVEEVTVNQRPIVDQDPKVKTEESNQYHQQNTEEQLHNKMDNLLESIDPKAKKPVTPLASQGKKSTDLVEEYEKDANNVVGQKKIINKEGKEENVDARKYYKEQFEQKAKDLREKAQQFKLEREKSAQNWMSRAQMYSSAFSQASSALFNMSVTYQDRKDQAYTAAAESRNSAMSSMATQIQGAAGSSISEAAKEASQQAQLITQTQSSK